MFLKKCSFFKYMLLVISVACLGCSTDNTAVAPEPEIVEPEPEPDWADGTITIEIGHHISGEDLLTSLKALKYQVEYRKQSVHIGGGSFGRLKEPDFPMSMKKGVVEVEVSIVTMLEAGIQEPATVPEILSRYKELGYRPLTLEEAVELRIQFLDQPPVSSGHKTSAFYTLLEEEGDNALEWFFEEDGSKFTMLWGIFHATKYYSDNPVTVKSDLVIGSYRSLTYGEYHLKDPHDQDPLDLDHVYYPVWDVIWGEKRPPTAFACVKM